ncbi:hypothetical protein CRG98_016906 [Punica granatum]|uniref:Uncharacterized protein n=1 Tax=Punica granatum TaxID=22663 RepID=A0A2I0K253_PUNGR|nr:hypothetical protein CRG98_016906 [Punica granatum]
MVTRVLRGYISSFYTPTKPIAKCKHVPFDGQEMMFQEWKGIKRCGNPPRRLRHSYDTISIRKIKSGSRWPRCGRGPLPVLWVPRSCRRVLLRFVADSMAACHADPRLLSLGRRNVRPKRFASAPLRSVAAARRWMDGY